MPQRLSWYFHGRERRGRLDRLRSRYSGCGGQVAASRRESAGYDRPQRLVVSYVYNFPRFNSGEGFTGHALSGWSLAGVTTVQSGNPITLSDSRGGQVYGAVGTSGANLCSGETIADVFNSGSIVSRVRSGKYFNTSAFCAPPVIGQVGDGTGGATRLRKRLRMNPVLGPGQFNWDISIQKHTTVGGLSENADLEFRTDFFNAFNHPAVQQSHGERRQRLHLRRHHDHVCGPAHHPVCAKIRFLRMRR